MFAVTILHLPDDGRDSGCVNASRFHQAGGSLDVICVDGIEELVDLADSGQFFQDQRAFEIRVLHGFFNARQFAHDKGSLLLYTFVRNQRACAFYERSGFVAIERGFEKDWQLEDVKPEWKVAR